VPRWHIPGNSALRSVAKEMLSKGDLSITDVALAVGFSDASQLNRVFQKIDWSYANGFSARDWP
jgi:methylphosphotriester-DNA--protein-cysteine methyltransferase